MNDKNPQFPLNGDYDDSLFSADEVENDIGADVQAIMESDGNQPSGTADAAESASDNNTLFFTGTNGTPAMEDSHGQPTEESLHHDLLSTPMIGQEILADEHAVDAIGLTHPVQPNSGKDLQSSYTLESTDPSAGNGYTSPANIDGALFETTVFDTNQMPPIQDYVDPSSMLDAQQPDPEPVPEEPPLPKRRPKMKRGYGLLGIPHILSTVIWLAITVIIGVSLGRVVWVCAAEVLAFGSPDQEYVLTVSDGDNIDTIAAKLEQAGLIKYPELFKLYADLTDAEADISAGTFTLNSKYDYMALVNAMTYHSSAREEVEIMIPEGYTCAQIFNLLAQKGVCTVEELEDYAANGPLDEYWFMEGVTRGDRYCLEGYLFPDTYRFYTNDEPENVLEKFLDNFDNRFTDIMKEKIDPLNQRMAAVLASRGFSEEQIEDRKLTIRKIIIIASMIEKETASDAESYNISSVIYNRLTNPGSYPFLNIDATIIYALGGNIDPETGKTKPLTSADLELDSPYNTYTVKGLIPGPISNPGRNSINAALDPTETKFYYYVYNPNTGRHLFAEKASEHEKNVNYVKSLKG